MGALHRFEQRLEHLVTGAFARVFRSAVQPVEIAAALQREVDNSAQILSRDRRLAPNDFTIDLSSTDYDSLSAYGQSLVSELATMMHTYASEQGYVFAGPLHMNFHRSGELSTGRFRVRSAASATVTPAAGQSLKPTDTAIRRSSAVLEIGAARHVIEPPGLVIGRGSNADLRIEDPGISRRHLEVRVQEQGGATIVSAIDLGSTNGTTVDGHRAQQALLHEGSVIKIGTTTIVVRVRDQDADEPAAPAPPQHQYYEPRPYSGPPPSDGASDARGG
jgi:hypothetical protein